MVAGKNQDPSSPDQLKHVSAAFTAANREVAPLPLYSVYLRPHCTGSVWTTLVRPALRPDLVVFTRGSCPFSPAPLRFAHRRQRLKSAIPKRKKTAGKPAASHQERYARAHHSQPRRGADATGEPTPRPLSADRWYRHKLLFVSPELRYLSRAFISCRAELVRTGNHYDPLEGTSARSARRYDLHPHHWPCVRACPGHRRPRRHRRGNGVDPARTEPRHLSETSHHQISKKTARPHPAQHPRRATGVVNSLPIGHTSPSSSPSSSCFLMVYALRMDSAKTWTSHHETYPS